MATNIDWDALAKENNHGYKDYAEDGKHKVKVVGVEFKEVGSNGSIVQKFQFEETDVAYPTADHWLSFNNDNWRRWHNKELMVLLGASEENAKKAVELCEDKDDKETIIKAYDATYKKLLAKKPAVDIEVWTDGKYARADFISNKVRMNRPEEEPKETDSLADAEDVSEEISMDEVPF